MQDLKQLAFVGVDTHKDQHTACVTDCFSRNLATFDIPNDPNNFEELTSRVNIISNENRLKPVFGLEDARHFGQKLVPQVPHSTCHAHRHPPRIPQPRYRDGIRPSHFHGRHTQGLQGGGPILATGG